jgi:hypothetical protein
MFFLMSLLSAKEISFFLFSRSLARSHAIANCRYRKVKLPLPLHSFIFRLAYNHHHRVTVISITVNNALKMPRYCRCTNTPAAAAAVPYI